LKKRRASTGHGGGASPSSRRPVHDPLMDVTAPRAGCKTIWRLVMSAKLKMMLSAALLLGTASAAFADATEDYSNYPLANAYKYCDRGNAFACAQARQFNGEDNARSAFGAAYPVIPVPAHRARYRTR